MRTAIIFSSLLVLSLGLSSACASHVPATVSWTARVPITTSASIYVLAQRQHERIVKSLVDAGLKVSDEWTGEGYSLKVSVGSSRLRRGCGTVNNVAYVLNGDGQRLMVIKGRGATGSCEPNVFDDMSRTLATYADEA